jgi:hypothetical protein
MSQRSEQLSNQTNSHVIAGEEELANKKKKVAKHRRRSNDRITQLYPIHMKYSYFIRISIQYFIDSRELQSLLFFVLFFFFFLLVGSVIQSNRLQNQSQTKNKATNTALLLERSCAFDQHSTTSTMSSPSTPKPEPRRRSSARQPQVRSSTLAGNHLATTALSLIAEVGATSTSLPTQQKQSAAALSSAQTTPQLSELSPDESPSVDPHLIFDRISHRCVSSHL